MQGNAWCRCRRLFFDALTEIKILRIEILHMWRIQALKVTPLNEKCRREACRHLQC